MSSTYCLLKGFFGIPHSLGISTRWGSTNDLSLFLPHNKNKVLRGKKNEQREIHKSSRRRGKSAK